MHRTDHQILYEYLNTSLISVITVLLIDYFIHLCFHLVVAVESINYCTQCFLICIRISFWFCIRKCHMCVHSSSHHQHYLLSFSETVSFFINILDIINYSMKLKHIVDYLYFDQIVSWSLNYDLHSLNYNHCSLNQQCASSSCCM